MNSKRSLRFVAVAMALALASSLTTGAEDSQRTRLSPLSPAMNGEYRCSNGKTFTAVVLGSVIVGGELVPAPSGLEATGANGTVHMQMKHEVEAFDYHGATVKFAGTDYKLMLQDGAPTVLKDSDGRLRWELASNEKPFSGRLSGGGTELGAGCVLVTPIIGKP